jgi:hypothetical protein
MSNKWIDIISNSKERSVVFNVAAWLSRATLDAIGEGEIYSVTQLPLSSSPSSAAFDVHFGAMDNKESALTRSYHNMMSVLTSCHASRVFLDWNLLN